MFKTLVARKVLLWALGGVGCLGVLLLAVFVLLVVVVPGSDKDRSVGAAISPDGQVVAEMHHVVTPMWGGADRLEVSLRKAGESRGEVVYSRMLECGNFEDFKIRWRSAKEVDFALGHCDVGLYNGRPSDEMVYRKLTMWRGVRIEYRDVRGEAGAAGNR